MFGFTAEEIAAMGDPKFPELMNVLLWAEYSHLGVAPHEIDEHWHRYRGDGGVDHGGSLNLPVDDSKSRWVPSPDTVWQYKSGSGFNVADVGDELRQSSHQRMRDRTGEGATYVLVVPNWDGDQRREGKELAIQVFTSLHGEALDDDRVVVYLAEQIREWLLERSHVLARFGRGSGALKRLEDIPFPRVIERRSGKEQLRKEMIDAVKEFRREIIETVKELYRGRERATTSRVPVTDHDSNVLTDADGRVVYQEITHNPMTSQMNIQRCRSTYYCRTISLTRVWTASPLGATI